MADQVSGVSDSPPREISATLQPEQTTFLFFMGCGGEGRHLFADDFATHEQNVAACSGGG